jgi:hypothetical protein
MVFIDEYEAPISRAYEYNFFPHGASFVSLPVMVKAEDNDLG